MELSIIVPAYNEEKRLRHEKTLDNYASFFSKIYKNEFEIIVVLNGCIDDTIGVVKEAAKKHKQIRLVDIGNAIGKGGAVIEGFKLATGNLMGFVDADQSTKAAAFYALVKNINGYDCAIASRWLADSIVTPKRAWYRDIPSILFNLLVRILFGLNFKDTQCGAKLVKKEPLKSVLRCLTLKRWAFDIDLLYNLKRKGFKIKEFPTVWAEKSGTRLTWKTPYEMFLSVIKLRFKNL